LSLSRFGGEDKCVGIILTGETTVVKEKLVTVLLCPPQIPYGLTQAAAVTHDHLNHSTTLKAVFLPIA
jgi:hypothetical protein